MSKRLSSEGAKSELSPSHKRHVEIPLEMLGNNCNLLVLGKNCFARGYKELLSDRPHAGES